MDYLGQNLFEMEKERVSKNVRIILIICLVLMLAAVRLFEEHLFYDPFIRFFRSDYLLGDLPAYQMPKLLLNLTFRFVLNTLISLGIIYLAFRDRQIMKFSGLLYGILFLVGISIFIFLLLNLEKEHFLALFYVRRFLIHPIFILLLLPAFYYYRLSISRNSESIS